MTRPLPEKRKLKKKPEPDRFEAERKRAEQEKSGLEEMFRRQVKRMVIV
jgi:hypothetical protein